MKKLSFNLLLLLSLAAGISSCQKTEVDPKAPGSVTGSQDASGYQKDIARKAYLFLRTPGPFGAGHTGVGFIIEKELYNAHYNKTMYRYWAYCGGVENPNAIPLIAPGQTGNGGWSARTMHHSASEAAAWMKKRMKIEGYTQYKCEFLKGAPNGLVPLAEGNTVEHNAFWGIMNQFPTRGYALNGNNCMNASFEVLQALGASSVALPGANWTPNWQFNNTGKDGSWLVPLPL